MIEFATKEPLNFMKITPSYNVPINKKFSKNWLEYMDPRQFGSSPLQDDESIEEQEDSDDDEYIPVQNVVSKRKYTRGTTK